MLCVDFTLAKVRAQANFGDLAPGLPGEYAVWGTDETGWPTSAGAPGKQLAQWLDRGGDSAAPVRAVLGFCGAASLATTLASAVGSAPQVVLFNPVTVNGQTMVDQFDASLRRVAGTVDEAALRAARADLPTSGDLDELGTLLARRYAAVAGAACAAQGVPPSIVDQLCQRVETNLRYLALCATASLDTARPTLLVLSRDHAGSPAQLRGVPEVRVDATQNELLSHPDAARAVAGVLAGELAGDR